MGHCLSSCLYIRKRQTKCEISIPKYVSFPMIQINETVNIKETQNNLILGETFTDCSLLSESNSKNKYKHSLSDSEGCPKFPENITLEVIDERLIKMYESYMEPNVDLILSTGIENFCQDLNLPPEDYQILVIAWKLKASTMCQFSKQEFLQGFQSLQIYSIEDIKIKLPELINESKLHFRDLYQWTFKFGLESPENNLPIDMAISLWKLVFQFLNPPILNCWISFLEKNPQINSIKQDTWNLFLHFVELFPEDLINYNDSDAWPSLFDDFVEFEIDRRNQNNFSDCFDKQLNYSG